MRTLLVNLDTQGLQWGRVRLDAEIVALEASSSGLPELQWCRVRLDAEILPRLAGTGRGSDTLQWGRVQPDAEIRQKADEAATAQTLQWGRVQPDAEMPRRRR